jgi:hypothetical protein
MTVTMTVMLTTNEGNWPMKMRDDDGHRAGMQAKRAWQDIKQSTVRAWSHWTMKIGPWMVQARAEAMAVAETDAPIGRAYCQAMSGLLEEYKLNDMAETARADLLKIMDKFTAVSEWRAKQDDPSDLNHPSTVWRKYSKGSSDEADKKTEKKRAKAKKDQTELEADLAFAQNRIQQLEARVQELEEELASARERIAQLERELSKEFTS